MVDLTKYKIGTANITTDLPTAYVREIGRIIVKWAYMHECLKRATYRVVGVGPKVGRLMITEPKPPQHVDTLETALALRKHKVKTNFKRLRELVEETTSYRDKLAHCIWVDYENGRYGLQLTKNNWTPDGTRGKVSRKLVPEGVLCDVKDLLHIKAMIEEATEVLNALGKELEAAPDPWPETLP